MASIALQRGTDPGRVERRDSWWLEVAPVIIVLGGFSIYATWAALVNAHYYVAPYLSPFYSPCLVTTCQHVTLPLIGGWWPLSPAILILWVPLGFRATCYYYRKAYYRSFFFSPPACAVPDAPKRYTGEARFPFLIQNLHRYFFYFSLIVLIFLWWDVIMAFNFPDGFGMGLGTVVLFTASALLTLYTFSCHSCRYLCGGHLDSFHRKPVRQRLWQITNVLNPKHAQFAWVSLFGVALADLYVRLLSMGVIQDFRFF